jgi:hypothetical protein
MSPSRSIGKGTTASLRRQAARADPLTDVAQEIGFLSGKISHDEPAQEQALAQHREHVGAGHRPGRVVLCDQPTHGNPGNGAQTGDLHLRVGDHAVQVETPC